jgi:hypothetical protein
MLGDAPRVRHHLFAVDQNRDLVLPAECDRGLIAYADWPDLGLQTLVGQRKAGSPGELAVAPIVLSAEFIEDNGHRASAWIRFAPQSGNGSVSPVLSYPLRSYQAISISRAFAGHTSNHDAPAIKARS